VFLFFFMQSASPFVVVPGILSVCAFETFTFPPIDGRFAASRRKKSCLEEVAMKTSIFSFYFWPLGDTSDTIEIR
jgi:hypothetical protein